MARKKTEETATEQDEDLGNIIDRAWDDMPEEQLLPVGSYLLSVRNLAYVPPKDSGNGKVIAFFIPKAAKDDVDEDALAELGAGYDITQNEVTATFWIERNRDWQPVRDLLKAAGVDMEGGLSIKESFKAARKGEVVGYVDTRSFTRANGETVTQNVATQFSAAE